jgi:hypothetical protein
MTNPKGTDPAERTERRKQPRDPESSPDWEQIVLQRVARHVRSLPDQPAPGPDGSTSNRWEDAAVQKLKKHLLDFDSDR